ncbi:MAG TPA: DoxX family protein [Edaphobacter sp.]|nr:DoxX family protein [Edaphobacter sp.]
MQIEIKAGRPSNKLLWTGRILSILAIVFMLFDGIGHLLKPAPVVQAFVQLGFPLRLSITIGVIQLVCVILYAIPRTAVLGAVLLTGYLGGAVAIHMRVGNPLFECIFPVLIGVLFWAGLLLRDPRLRAVFPVSK